MATIDWDNIKENNFKSYAEDGEYTVKCIGVEFKEVGSNGSIIEKFKFEETNDTVFPTADHWLAKNNDNFRYVHQKNLLVFFGAREANARAAVEKAEDGDLNHAAKLYESYLNNLLAKKPEVKIQVFTEVNENTGKAYSRADFVDRKVRMNREKKANATVTASDDEQLDLSDMPF